MVTGVACGLQNRYGAFVRPGWVRFPHVPATRCLVLALLVVLGVLVGAPGAGGAGALLAQADSVRAGEPSPPEGEAGAAERTPAPEATAAPQEVPADTLPPVSPLAAFGRSILLPGWGQTAVDRPVRGAVYFTLEAASLFMLLRSQARLGAASRAEPPDEELLRRRRGAREDWIVFSVFVAFASGLDAWVSARLWDFEAEVEPPPEAGVGLALRVELPVSFP